ncbi:phenylalanine--tRNA ligase subunit alpha [Candidatus Roizmanbacteria bacterium CG11_big_fil_rev_8_21_14_0_20_36_8]|uniref:Phenylalanine--tRNA ligase alpha subunit n=2 Tax=Candidatus Roizmaniibacteriota TaxID=1752723 RepID=A0A2M6ITD6_9BACT|nr:MAG: phenylalanine--tRNA ligase subunit alpha [Candidatus Roizmanbacteria bacterium CG11_big_fil_rev_8_21_14_0_20_36_8]PIZ66032.1 MAG: phenylalanine--tRNA ligase subunit alpha [Candidatus Roizmanbacteria bacterium CG_4_10_14_0_2_um_filter_36_9]
MKDLKTTREKFQVKLTSIVSLPQLELLKLEYLSRNGIVNELLKDMKSLSIDERKIYGQQINKLKDEIAKQLDSTQKKLISSLNQSKYDVTLPGNMRKNGSLHVVSYAIEEISKIFEKIGFIRMSYPEVEWDWYSFEALNMPSNHPARDDFETFYIDHPENKEFGKMLLTPHTSSGQPREMMRLGKPPIRMINIAKTYRPNWDVSHTPMFHQFEGFCVDKKINITHLKGTINYFVKEFFGENREIRLRPFHFQFTEPSFEIDITCDICDGTGYIFKDELQTKNAKSRSFAEKIKCKLCKQGWLELGGSGMVHPNILKFSGINPDEYTGWAFGFGVERVMMMKTGVGLNDIRLLYEGDIRVLEQF